MFDKIRRYGLLVLLTVQYTAAVLCLRYSRVTIPSVPDQQGGNVTRTQEPHPMYLASSLVLTMEIIKLIISIILLCIQFSCSVKQTAVTLYKDIFCRPSDTAVLAVPGLLYIIQDNLVIYALSHVDVPTYTVTYQARILMTAFFAKILLKKHLNRLHWVALTLLTVGVVMAQFRVDKLKGSLSFRLESEGPQYILGLMAVTGAALISAFAGIYNERAMKNGQQPLFLIRSIQLNLFAVIFAAVAVPVMEWQAVVELGYFYGYGPLIWVTAFIQAFGGILVAATVKFADSILKTFAVSISIVLSCTLSHWLFGDLNFAPTFAMGTAIIILSTILYSKASLPNDKSSTPNC